jgi:hypothetical protein
MFVTNGDKKMKDIIRSALVFVGPAFALLLLGFTGYQTYSLIYTVTASHLTAVIGLILFEVGMMYWWFVFRNEAEGLPQMALSLMVFIACLLFVVLATSLKLGAVGDTALGVNTPAKIITAAAVVQLAAKLLFPLLHPDVAHAIKERAQEGKIVSAADKKFEAKIDGMADAYADAKADAQVARLLTNLNTKHGTRYELPAGYVPTIIEGQAPPAPPTIEQQVTRLLNDIERDKARPSVMDKLLGRRPSTPSVDPAMVAAIVDAIGRNTHNEPLTPAERGQVFDLYETPVIPLAQPAPGQGERRQDNGPAGRKVDGAPPDF